MSVTVGEGEVETNQTFTTSGSHCWEPDGTFHSVCIFVLSVSALCSIATIVTVYRIVIMIMQAIRYFVNTSLMKSSEGTKCHPVMAFYLPFVTSVSMYWYLSGMISLPCPMHGKVQKAHT